MSKPSYTASEKLLAEIVIDAFRDLDQAVMAMRQNEWHKSQDKALRLIYLGTEAALKGQILPYRAAIEVSNAPQASEIERLPAWNGYPDDNQPAQEEGPKP